MNDTRYRDEEWLKEQYVEQKRSTYEIADDCGCVRSTITTWLEEYEIERRGGDKTPPKRLTDRKWLREQYLSKGSTVKEIAEDCGCSAKTVCRWLDRHDIDKRETKYRSLTDKKWLREQYIEKQQTAYDIAEECGCDKTVVCKWLHKHGIEMDENPRTSSDKRVADEKWLREQYIEKQRTLLDIAEQCECSANCVREWLIRHDINRRKAGKRPKYPRLTDKEWLREQYVEQNRTTFDIADECGCSRTSVSSWLRKHGITSHDTSGKNHWNWKGGKFPYGSGWNETKKKKVRERDDYCCQKCGMTQNKHKNEWGEKLHVHHLIKAREIDDAEKRNALENLITLCRNCHYKWEKVSEARIRPQISE